MTHYDDKLRRVVTTCWSTPYIRSSLKTYPVALLFYDRKCDLTKDEQAALMLSSDVRHVFTDFYYGVEIKNKHNSFNMFYIANKISDMYFLKERDRAFFLIREGTVYETTFNDINNNCMLLQKWMGESCCKCTWRGDRCIHTWHDKNIVAEDTRAKQLHFGFYDVGPFLTKNTITRLINATENFTNCDWADLKCEKKWKHWKSTLANHTIIPNVATASRPLNPTPRVQSPFDCDFTSLEESKKLLSVRSRAAGKTQSHIKKQCSVCYFGGNRRYKAVCNKYNPRHCKHGAWTEERIVDYTLERYDVALRTYSQLTLKDAWVIAQLAGKRFKVKSAVTKREREWQICSIRHPLPFTCRGKDAIRIFVSRTARRMEHEALAFTSAKELKKFLPPTMLEHWNSVSKIPIDRKAMALWCHVSILTHAKKYSYYFSDKNTCGYLNHQPRIGSVCLVSVADYHVGLNVLYSRRTEYLTFGNLNAFYSHFTELPLFNITDEEDDKFIPNLSYRPY